MLTGVFADELAATMEAVTFAAPVAVRDPTPQTQRPRVRHAGYGPPRVGQLWADRAARPAGGSPGRRVRRIGHLASVESGRTVTAPMSAATSWPQTQQNAPPG